MISRNIGGVLTMRCSLFKAGILIFCFSVLAMGCSTRGTFNGGQMEMYAIPEEEAEWIRNGDPIEFDGKLWYPQDGIENLLDSEVYLMGEYRGVQFFVEKIDVKPYDRIYTKFSRNHFRYFEEKRDD